MSAFVATDDLLLHELVNRSAVDSHRLADLREKPFRPLVDTPALFLEFAGLIEEEIAKDVWLDWIRRHGVLGFEGNGEIADRWWAEPRGGPKETLTAFKDAAWRANAVLRIYEAATAPDGPDTAILAKFVSQPSAYPE